MVVIPEQKLTRRPFGGTMTGPGTRRVPGPPGRVLTPQERGRLVALAQQIAERHGIPARRFVATVQSISGFNPSARKPDGGVGIAGLKPGDAQVDPFDPVQALTALAWRLRQQG